MKTPAQAMLWELWRTSRWEMLGRISWPVALMFLMFQSPLADSLAGMELQVVRGIFVMLIIVTSVASSTWWLAFDRQQSGFSFRLGFVRPVSTSLLVGIPMCYTMFTATLCFLIPALLARWVEDFRVPLLGPSVFVSTITALMIAASWSPTTLVGKACSLTGLGVCLIGGMQFLQWFRGSEDPLLMALGHRSYFDFPWYAFVCCLGVVLAAHRVAVAAVDRQRHGDVSTRRRFSFASRNSSTARRAVSGRAFSNRFAAQCWYEFRRFGPAVLIVGMVATVFPAACATIIPLVDPAWRGAAFLWCIALVLCPFACQIVGADGALGLSRKQGAIWISAFDSTRPMSNDHLVAIKVLVMSLCSIIAWGTVASGAAIHAWLSNETESWQRVGHLITRSAGEIPPWAWLVASVSVVLLYGSSSAMFLAFGLWLPRHSRRFVGLTLFGYAQIMLAVWDAHNGWRLQLMWSAYGYISAALIVATCVVALRRAFAAGCLGRRLFLGTASLWGVYVIGAVTLYMQSDLQRPIPAAALAVLAASLLIPLASAAFAPLALAAHRHAA